jgi:hypothetical protein
MLLYYFVHVPRPMDDVVQALTDSPSDLTVWARLAFEGGEELRTRVQPSIGVVTKEVEIVIGSPRPAGSVVFVPVSWKATGVEALFPVLEADLIIEAVGDGMTSITLRGSYKPPLGPVGRLLDRALLHHLAEACVKSFLDRIADALSQSPEVATNGA